MFEHMPPMETISLAIVLAVYVVVGSYALFVFIPRNVTRKKKNVSANIAALKDMVEMLHIERTTIEKFLEKHSVTIKFKSHEGELFLSGITKVIEDFTDFLQKSPGYYAGRNIFTLHRIIQLEHKSLSIDGELYEVRFQTQKIKRSLEMCIARGINPNPKKQVPLIHSPKGVFPYYREPIRTGDQVDIFINTAEDCVES